MWLGVFSLSTTEVDLSWSGNAAFGIAATALGALGAIDIAVHRLPLRISYTAFALVVVLLVVSSVSEVARAQDVLIGASLMLLLIGLLRIVSHGSLGRGDLHLAPLLGALIGWFDPHRILVACVVMAVSAAVFAGGLMVAHQRKRSDFIAYGPFMLFGAAFAIVGTRGGY